MPLAYAIKCFACESVYDASCAEDFEVENYFKFDCAFMAPPRFLETDLLTVNATACLKRIFKGKFNGEYLILNIILNINLILNPNMVVAIKS